MIEMNLKSIQSFLESLKLAPQLQQETNQLYVVFKHENFEFPLFLRIFEESQLLQLILFIPFATQENTNSDVARLLHLLNKELDIPGFGMDEAAKLIFYRLMLPCNDKKISKEVLTAYIGTVQNVLQTFTPVIANVASGQSSFDEVLKKVKESQNQ